MAREFIRPLNGGDTYSQEYLLFTGSYRNVPMLKADDGWGKLPSDRVNTEAFLIQRVGDLLEQADRPVVVMDVGAAAGMSAMRLAKRYERQVRESRLAVVATNASMRVAEYVEKLGWKVKDEADQLLRSRQFHELQADFSRGSSNIITLPDGTRLDLLDGVDIAHERLSLTAWSKNPRHDIPELGKFLSSRSLYMVPLEDMTYQQPNGWLRPVSAISDIHHSLCLERRLEVVEACEEGVLEGQPLWHRMLRGQDAPPIRIEPVASSVPRAA